ncbi:hypothetical protein DH2020_036718 [Rehmannia glutinosa]|uniref:Uncharacterized protein n=1 Tax=Rehmannia glutinosa TaxID=99300 RepID=A0ABR0V3G8_REHGL
MEHQNHHALLLSMNQTHHHILEQPLFLPSHHHHQSRLSHHYLGGAAAGDDSSSLFRRPVDFKLGLNEICSNNDNKFDGTIINEGEDGLLGGSEQFEVPGARQFSLGMPHYCWQNQQDSHIKPRTFWEPLPAEVSNENSHIIDRPENIETHHKEVHPTKYCLDSKNRPLFGELESIYKRLDNSETNQTVPYYETSPVNLYSGKTTAKRKKKTKKKKTNTCYNDRIMINPMARFFEDLVKQMMRHQENLQQNYAKVIENMDEEIRKRERDRELARFEQELAEERAREKAVAASREAIIVSYLEKVTGQRISLPSFNPNLDPSAPIIYWSRIQQTGHIQ